MYTIERKDRRIIVKKGDHARLNAPEDSYVVYKDSATGEQKVSKLCDLGGPSTAAGAGQRD